MLGLVRSGDFRNGTPTTAPHAFGTPITLPEPQGNVNPQANSSLSSNPVTWAPSPAYFGNTVDLSLQTVAPIVVVAPGGTGATNINLTQLLGTPTPTLTYSGAPAGVTLAFAPNPDTGTSVCTITVGASVPSGKYMITIVGISGTEVDTTNLHLVVAGTSAPSNPIAFVGTGNTYDQVIGLNSTITLDYVSTAGNTLLLQLTCSNDEGAIGAVQSVVDSAGNEWTQINTNVSPTVDYQEMWGCSSAGAITSITVTVAGVSSPPVNYYTLFLGISEYSGVVSIGSSTQVSIEGGGFPTISQSLTAGGNWLVASFLSSQIVATNTATSGTLRYAVGLSGGGGFATSSGTTMTFKSGGFFIPTTVAPGQNIEWPGFSITFNSSSYTVATVPSPTTLTTVETLPTETGSGKQWAYNAQGSGNDLAMADTTASSAEDVTVTVSMGSINNYGAIAVELISV